MDTGHKDMLIDVESEKLQQVAAEIHGGINRYSSGKIQTVANDLK